MSAVFTDIVQNNVSIFSMSVHIGYDSDAWIKPRETVHCVVLQLRTMVSC